MADQYSNEGSSTSNVSGDSSGATVELNIKTLESQIYSLKVDKNMPVSTFKEKIASEIGVPVGQQRLIFRGRVLKDDHLLSEYQVENGHTLHLVARQPVQPQPSADTSAGDGNNSSRGNDSSGYTSQNRVGQISHSVVLGTFNVGDQVEGIVPDLSRVVGAVLNSIGVGVQPVTNGAGGMQSSTLNINAQSLQGNETGGLVGSVGVQNQAGNQTQPGQGFARQPFQAAPQVVQIPLAAATPVPSLNSPIPDSLNTLSEFMTRMEQALVQNGYQPNASSTMLGDQPRVELPSNARGMPTTEALSTVLRHAERLLGGSSVAALSHIARRLEEEGASTDPTIRGQIQTESVQVGFAMQHLGALLLELGRTILTLRMGQSPAESSVNAGPAVYISPAGPNPIMVQPFPLQTNSLFGGSVPTSNPLGHVGIGNAPRHVNIHIHAGTSLAPVISTVGTRATSGEGVQGEHGNGTNSVGSAQMRVLPVRNIIAAAVPSRSTGAGVSNAPPPQMGISLSQLQSDSAPLSSVIADISSQLRDFVGNMQGGNRPQSGSVGSSTGCGVSNGQTNSTVVDEPRSSSVSLPAALPEGDVQKKPEEPALTKENVLSARDVLSSEGSSSGRTTVKSEEMSENVPSSSEKHDLPEDARAAPLGLGLGGLERKMRSRQPKSVVGSSETATTSSLLHQNLDAGSSGRHLLQSLASRSSVTNRVGASDTISRDIPPSVGGSTESRPLGEQGSHRQPDAASAMSQVLQSPALNNLLAGVSEQTGVGSPNVFRNMLQQLAQNPQIMSTVSQIAQQVDSQDLGNMMSGLGSGQGGGIDLSRMVQQMMPVVSQVLGGGSASPQPFPSVEPALQLQNNERAPIRADNSNENIQIDLQEVAQRIEDLGDPSDIFQAVVQNAVRLNGNESSNDDIVHEISISEDLANDYMDMLGRDINRRLQGDPGQDKC